MTQPGEEQGGPQSAQPDDGGASVPDPLAPAPAARPRPERAAWPLLAAVGLGLSAHALTWSTGGKFGINLPALVALLTFACLWGLRRRDQAPSRSGLTLLGAAFLFALSFAVWAVPAQLSFLNSLALLLALVLGVAALRFPELGAAGLAALLGTAFTGGLRLIYGPLALLERFPWARVQTPRGGRAGRALVGAVLTLPVLLVFGGLLSNADGGFQRLVAGLLDWEADDLIRGAVQWGVWTALAGGLIYPAVLARRPSLFAEADPSGVRAGQPNPGWPRLGFLELGLPLGALSALFVLFVGTQLPYLLSGLTLPEGLTFAEYIRRGFGELLLVAFLTLAVLLTAFSLARSDVRAGLGYRLLNLAVLAPLALVILSAANRWRLYTLAYGLSETRVLGAALLVWLVLALAWLGARLWRSDTRRFAFPALLMGLGTLLVTTALNPAALIARVNLDRQLSGVTNELRRTPQPVQATELLALGAGAVPILAAHLDDLPPLCGPTQDCPDARQLVIDRLHERYDAPRDPRAWNAAYARAHAVVQTLPPHSGNYSRSD